MLAGITPPSAHARTLRTWECARNLAGRMLKLPRLGTIREAQYLSQYELAAKSGIARSTIARIEKGEAARFETIRKLAAALGVTADDLVGKA